MTIEIGAYDAKTRLPELLRQVAAGERFIITHRGKPIAELAPPGTDHSAGLAEALRAFDAMRAAHPVPPGIDLRALREDGRA